MKGFAAAVARLDAEADARLGDSQPGMPLFYDIGGVVATQATPGFFVDPNDLNMSIEASDAPLDNIGRRVRLQIAKRYVPTPSKTDRVRSAHPLCAGGRMKPTAWLPSNSGRYWLMDLERA